MWIERADDGREVLGVLNHRYDLSVLECSSPAPWYAVAYDTELSELVLAKDMPNGQSVDCPTCARYCAAALGEAIDHLECY